MKMNKPEVHPGFENKNWFIVITAILLITMLKGIRFPNMWSYSHFLFNYDHGFVKRGLIGAIMGLFNSPFLISYEFFFLFSIIIFIINIVLLCLLIRDMTDSQNNISGLSAMVFASSLAIVFLSHTVGYFDHLGLMIALITFRMNGFYKKFRFLLITLPFVLLIHEAILIIFYPVIFISLLLSIEKEERKKKLITLWVFSAVLVIFVGIISNSQLTMPEAKDMYTRLQAKIAYPLRQDAFLVLTRDSKANFEIMKSIWHSPETSGQFTTSLIVTAPSFLVLIYLVILILRKAKVNFNLIMFSAAAALSPMLMHLAGWDMHRWNTLVITTSFLMFYVVFTKNKNESFTASGYLISILVLVIFLNGISVIDLFDGYYVKQFPFSDLWHYITNFLNGTAEFPTVPSI